MSQQKNYAIIFIHTAFQCNDLRNFELKAPSLIYTEMNTCASSESDCKEAGISVEVKYNLINSLNLNSTI